MLLVANGHLYPTSKPLGIAVCLIGSQARKRLASQLVVAYTLGLGIWVLLQLLCGAGPELSFCQAKMGMFPFLLISGLQVRVVSRVLS